MASTEEELDWVLAQALMDDPLFARWFLDQTRFAGLDARSAEVRADNPWSRVTLTVPVGLDWVPTEVVRDAETDVLATVTELGWQFPGSTGPGDVIWPRT